MIDKDTMEAGVALLKEIENFLIVVTSTKAGWAFWGLLLLFIGWRIYRNERDATERNAVVKAKDNEIDRLSAEVKEYRTVLLTNFNVPKATLRKDEEDSTEVAKAKKSKK